MLFSVIFTAEDGNISKESNVKRAKRMDDVNLKTKEKKLKTAKINFMKKIAYILNPLVYVVFSALYFVYYLKFF